MSVVSNNTRNRFSKFSREDRERIVVDMMATGRSTQQEFDSNPQYYREMGIQDVDTLHGILNSVCSNLWKPLEKYHEKMAPAAERARAMIQTGTVPQGKEETVRRVISLTEGVAQELQQKGFRLDDSVEYRRIAKGTSGGRRSSSISSNLSGFDDILAENAQLLLDAEIAGEFDLDDDNE